jgi:cobalt-zinc-cadmium resistance protein CzcA
MAITVIIALVSAMILALTFVPPGIALLFRRPRPEKPNIVMGAAQSVYRPMLQSALEFRWPVILGAAALTLGCGWLASRFGAEFIPNLDEGDIAMHALRIPGTSLDQAIQLQMLDPALGAHARVCA